MVKKSSITAKLVRKSFSYNPKEGILRWATHRRGVQFGRRAGYLNKGSGHYSVSVLGHDFYVHVVVWLWVTGRWPNKLVDHRDGDKTNDKWSNLRLATKSQNAMNSKLRSDNRTGVKGVFEQRNGKFTAYIDSNRRRVYLGHAFKSLADAAQARKEAEKLYHGEFAR